MRQLTKRSTAIAATTVVALGAAGAAWAAWTLTGSGNAEAKAGSVVALKVSSAGLAPGGLTPGNPTTVLLTVFTVAAELVIGFIFAMVMHRAIFGRGPVRAADGLELQILRAFTVRALQRVAPVQGQLAAAGRAGAVGPQRQSCSAH